MSSAIARGKVTCPADASHVFEGKEILTVQAIDASRMDAASVTLGEQKITLQSGQSFPIDFEFSYDKSRAGPGQNGLLVQARIQAKNHTLLYIDDTSTPLVDNVAINVVKK